MNDINYQRVPPDGRQNWNFCSVKLFREFVFLDIPADRRAENEYEYPREQRKIIVADKIFACPAEYPKLVGIDSYIIDAPCGNGRADCRKNHRYGLRDFIPNLFCQRKKQHTDGQKMKHAENYRHFNKICHCGYSDCAAEGYKSPFQVASGKMRRYSAEHNKYSCKNIMQNIKNGVGKKHFRRIKEIYKVIKEMMDNHKYNGNASQRINYLNALFFRFLVAVAGLIAHLMPCIPLNKSECFRRRLKLYPSD